MVPAGERACAVPEREDGVLRGQTKVPHGDPEHRLLDDDPTRRAARAASLSKTVLVALSVAERRVGAAPDGVARSANRACAHAQMRICTRRCVPRLCRE